MSTKTDGCFAALVLFLIGAPITGALYGATLALNWNWFATTLGAPHIGYVQAYGLGLLVSAFTLNANAVKDADGAKDEGLVVQVLTLIFTSVLRNGIFAGMGWVVHAIMVG